MLGSLNHSRSFEWTALGKHPVAMDYIRLAGGSGLPEAVGEWMTKGYDQLRRRPQSDQGPYSYRFWLRGAKKGSLLFGLGRDSSDRIGRPYPFFIMGEGALKAWELSWEALPLQLDSAWRGMETIAAGRYDDIQSLTAALNQLSGPVEAPEPVQAIKQQGLHVSSAFRDELMDTGRTLIDLGAFQADDPALVVSGCLIGIKEWFREPPLVVFLGGTPKRSYLALVGTPLNTEDFIRLWSV